MLSYVIFAGQLSLFFFFQAEDGIRDAQESRGLGDVYKRQGYDVVDGPEVETEWHNFDALNLGPDHPARSMQDTFFVESADSGVVLRTHTSPVQVRTMPTQEPPIYMVAPGRVFRTDALDATHTPLCRPTGEKHIMNGSRELTRNGS